MISLASEMTDNKGRHARGWLFYDAECKFCIRMIKLVAGLLARRSLAVAPLQDPRVGALLGLPREELLQAMRFVSEDGRHHSGAYAFIAMAREFWWAGPLVWISKVPGMMAVLSAIYRQIAKRRSCATRGCSVEYGGD